MNKEENTTYLLIDVDTLEPIEFINDLKIYNQLENKKDIIVFRTFIDDEGEAQYSTNDKTIAFISMCVEAGKYTREQLVKATKKWDAYTYKNLEVEV